MRGRGRGGRGRGGFTGGRGSSLSFTSFMRESKEEKEDAETVGSEDGPPPLYPPMTLALPTLPTEKESFCLQAGNIFSQRYKSSVYFLKRRPEEKDDIERYSDKYQKLKDEKDLYRLMDLRESSGVPTELSVEARKHTLSSSDPTAAKLNSVNTMKDIGGGRSEDALKSIFQRLESTEKSQAAAGGPFTSGGRGTTSGGADNLSDAEFADGEFDDDGDYVKDYYASDGEDGDDGDNDAIYD